MRFATFVFLISTFILVGSTSFGQSVKDQTGFTQLAEELGSSLPDGSGLSVGIVEAPQASGAYLPDANSSQFAGKTITDGSGLNSSASGHASGVASRFFGNTISMASGIDDITGFDANDYLIRVLGAGDGSDPLEDSFFDITNHSYIANGVSDADQFAILSRFDFVTNRDNTVAVVGANNGASNATPDLLAPAFNAITVGRTDGSHSQTLTSGYGALRTKPDIVVPENTVSNATPWVSSAAGLILDAAQGTNATQNEAIRAIIFAGATKEEFADWDRTSTRPIDETFGVGELNIYNSYQIQQGGQFAGSSSDPSSAVGENGWDFQEDFGTGDELFYEFSVGPGEVLNNLSIVLSWNALITDVDASDGFAPLLDVADLSLELYDSDGGFLDTLIDSSDSTAYNVEHIWVPSGLTEGTYHLRVANASTNSIATDFALAFRSSISEPISVDFAISDGVVQRSMLTEVEVAFNKTVTLESGAFELLKRGTDGGPVDLISMIDDSGDGTVVTLEFSGQFVEGSGSLEDGNYQLTIDGDNILCEGVAADVDGDGVPGGILVLGDEEAEEFYRFAGDVDRNRIVNIFDLLGFRQTYLLMTGDASFDSAFDFNLDGFINVFDLLRFRQNYREVLPFEDSSSLSSGSGGSQTKGSSPRGGKR